MILLKRISFLSIFLFALLTIVAQTAGANPTTITADEDWTPPGTLISVSAQGDTPVIARAPNGEMMIVYNQWASTDPEDGTNGYYSISNNNGQTWSTPAVISATANIRQFIQVTYDRQNKAHAVWVQTPGSGSYQVIYANKPSGGAWTTPVVLSTANFPVPIRQAKIIESQLNIIDIIWDEPTSMETDTSLWHIRSTNGGTSWGTKTRVIASSIEPEKTAAIEVDQYGNLHVAWEQQTEGGGFDVYYSRLPAGSDTWNTRVNLTGGTLVAEKGFQPDLEVSKGKYINIAILYRNNPQVQLVYLRRCLLTSSCSSSSSWSNLREIGQFVAVSASDPFNIVPKLVYSDKVLLNYYHGLTNGTNNNELLWESSDCGNWNSTFVTPITARAINPSVVANETFTIYMAYERIENDIHQIYFMSGPVGCAKGHLPIIRR